jgi:hypothetical protein
MWDPFLVFIACHPFLSCTLPLIIASYLTFSKKFPLSRSIGIIGIAGTLIIFYVLNFRWDSFSIHLLRLDNNRTFTRKEIMFVGDSITCEGTRPRGYITKLVSLFNLNVSVICKKGATSEEILKRLRKDQKEDPKLIIAQSGINDLLSGSTISETQNSQNALYKKIKSIFPHAKIWFLPIHPILIEGKEFAGLAVPPGTECVSWQPDYHQFSDRFLTDDGIHLNAKGHSKLASLLAYNLSSREW